MRIAGSTRPGDPSAMLDLAGHAPIDKQTLVGGCIRLPLRIDPAPLQAELAALPAELWGRRDGRVGVHEVADAIFLRGHAPAQGELPIDDRPALSLLPSVRTLVFDRVPAEPMRCLIARLPPGAVVKPHIDRAPYFAKTLRVHVPLQTHDQAYMLCNGRSYRMAEGEFWLLNNSTTHAVWNAHPSASRTHLICDFLPSDALMQLIRAGERDLGVSRPDVDAHVATVQATTARPARRVTGA
ncbi:MAG: aspartyl/asparaginyl beta-hydroxylase domain-containing protein [Steroidobacteraceae bacterium]